MPLNNTSPSKRKQHIRIRQSTALQPASFVESPSIRNEVDIEYKESGPSSKKRVGRPRANTKKIAELDESVSKKNNNKDNGVNGNNQSKYNKRKNICRTIENVFPSLKRIKLSKPGPVTSILNRPFDRIKVNEEVKQIIIRNQPILRLTRINDCIIPIIRKKSPSKITKANQTTSSSATPSTEPITSAVREPVFIAVEDENTESNIVSQPSDITTDANISSSVMCRLCGVAGPNRFSLIGMKSERLNILCHLKNYLNIEVFDEENLPLHVCPLCSQTIISFYKFHGRVKTATNRLQAVVNESTLNPQRTWASVPWYGDNILATATATNDYLTKKHLRKLEKNKGKTQSNSKKFVTTNIEKLFGDKTKSNVLDNNLIVEENIDAEGIEDANHDTNDENWFLPERVTNKSMPQKPKQISKNIVTSNRNIETINLDDDDEPTKSPIVSTPIPQNKLQTTPRLVLSKPPTMTPKPTTVNNPISLIKSPVSGDNSNGPKTFLIPLQNLIGTGFTPGSQLKLAVSSNGQPILVQAGSANTLKIVPNQNAINEKHISPKPLASIIGVSNNSQNSIITSPVSVNQTLTTSNTSIPIQTVSSVPTILPKTTPSLLKSIPADSVVMSQTNLYPKAKIVGKNSPILQQTLTSLKVGSNVSSASTSLAKVITPSKNIITKTGTPVLQSAHTLKTVSSPISTKSVSTSISSVSTPVSISTPSVPTATKSTSALPTKGSPLIEKSLKTIPPPDIQKTISPTIQRSVASPKPTSSVVKSKSDMLDDLPLNAAEEKELNGNFRAPSKDDKYTYVVRMDRTVGEQPYFILTANPVKLKSPELTKHNVGIICKDVYKAEVEKKRVQENEGNFSNIGLHCWAQHIVWLWQLKLPGNVSMYVKQSADKILQFGQRKRIDYARKCFEVSKQICTEAVIKSKNQSMQAKKSAIPVSPSLPKLTSNDSNLPNTSKEILPKLIPKDATVTDLLPKLLPKDSSNINSTTQQLILIPVTDTSKNGNVTATYVISSNSSVKFQDVGLKSSAQQIGSNVISNIKLVPSTGINPISSTKQQPKPSNIETFEIPQSNVPETLQNKNILNSDSENHEIIDHQMMDIIETVEVSTSNATETILSDDDSNQNTEEITKIQIIYTDDDKESESLYEIECVSEDESHETSTDDILKRATIDALGDDKIIDGNASQYKN